VNGDLSHIFGGGFDTGSVPPQTDYEVLPPGKYPVLIEKAEVKPTKKGDGHYIELTLAVLDGPCKNRRVWDRINVANPNAQCVEIGLRSLAALGQAIGVPHVADTSQLLNQACIAHVKVKGEQNEVRTYSALTPAGAPGVPQVPQQPQYPVGQQQPYVPPQQQQAQYPPQQQAIAQPTAPPVAGGKPPWAR